MSNNPYANMGQAYPSSQPPYRSDDLKVPAICLLVLASISLFIFSGSEILDLYLLLSGIGNELAVPGGISNQTKTTVRLIWGLIAILCHIVIVIGCVAMLKRSSRSMSFTAAILSLIPCIGPCFIIGIPFGIWTLVVMNKSNLYPPFRR